MVESYPFLGNRIESALDALATVERIGLVRVNTAGMQLPTKLKERPIFTPGLRTEYREAFDETAQEFVAAAREDKLSPQQLLSGIIRFRAYDPGIQPGEFPVPPLKLITPEKVASTISWIEILGEAGTPFIIREPEARPRAVQRDNRRLPHVLRGILSFRNDTPGVSRGSMEIASVPFVDPKQNGLPNTAIVFNATIPQTRESVVTIPIETSALEMSRFIIGAEAIQSRWRTQRDRFNPHSLAAQHLAAPKRLATEVAIFHMLGVDLDTTSIDHILAQASLLA